MRETTATAESVQALSVLRAMRDATERALAAMERDDPDAARDAVDQGTAAAADLERLFHRLGTPSPELSREVGHVRVLQAIAVNRAESELEATAAELDKLSAHHRGLRGYSPASDPDNHSCLFES